ncbi:MAG: hypothetical protein KC657_10535 [Myxococcales bacterium]|nr:hypothetical protein [Myxococcales bacterium]
MRALVTIRAIGEGQRHLGLAYRPEVDAPFRMLHLAWHMCLRDDAEVGSSYRGVEIVGIPPELAPTIVAQCKRSAVADRHGLPYGFGYRPSSISRDPASGAIVLRGASGLTCATFVLGLLQLAGVELVALERWRDREGDDEWKMRIVGALAEQRADAAHLAAVQRDTHHVRVRPEDVAGAATVDDLPAGFEVAVARGCEVLAELYACA